MGEAANTSFRTIGFLILLIDNVRVLCTITKKSVANLVIPEIAAISCQRRGQCVSLEKGFGGFDYDYGGNGSKNGGLGRKACKVGGY
jgi:hypothetical protein